MADTKISDLAAVTDVQTSDDFVLARAGTTKRITGADLASELTGASLAFGQAHLTSGDLTGLGSTSFADLTGATVTISTGAHRVRVYCIAVCEGQNLGQNFHLDLNIDGTRVGGTNGLNWFNTYSSSRIDMGFTYVTDVLTAASHTFKLQYRVQSGTLKVYASSTNPLIIQAEETTLS